jgi:acetyl-CoA C-acetyltransferase
MSRQSSSAKPAVERSGLKPDDVKELLVGNILSGTLRPNAARQIEIGEDKMNLTIFN